MRIATKMTLTLAAVGLTLFGIYGVYLVQAEEQDLRRAVEREMWMVGRSLQVSVENALRDRQLEDIQETLEELRAIDDTVDIWVHDLRGQIIASSRNSGDEMDLPLHPIPGQGEEITRSFLVFDPPEDPTRLVLSMPLNLQGDGQVGGLIVDRPLTDMRLDLQATRRGIAVSVMIFVILALGLGALVGNWYITRPLSQFLKAMSRVRDGEFHPSELDKGQSREIREISFEFNEMVEALAEARRRLEEEAEASRRMQRGLQEADKLISIGQLSAGLAHEIGSPLQILNGRAHALLTKAENPDEVRRNADILITQSERITGIVEQLMHFARRRPISLGQVELASSVQAVVDLLDIEAKRRGVCLTFEAADDVPAIFADADKVQQIVLNLVTNALASTPSGGTIVVRLMSGQEGTLRLCVEDTGSGIDEEIRGRLFEPFFTTRASEGGVGLGLAIVKALVDEHQGQVHMESTLGEGSSFVIDLPTGRPSPLALRSLS